MIHIQDVYVNQETGHTIIGQTPVNGGIVIGETKFMADLVVPVQVGPQTLTVTVRSELKGETPEDAFASIPAAYEAAKATAVKVVEDQIKAQQEAEAKKIVVPGQAARLNGTNGHSHGLRLKY